MAGGNGRRAARGRARAPARRRNSALGGDPFPRGAAPSGAAPPPRPSPPPGEGEGQAAPPATSTATATPAATATARLAHAAAQLDGVERRLDSALGELEARVEDLAARAGLGALEAELRVALARLAPAVEQRLGTLADLARLLEPPERLDRHGMDARFAARVEPLVELLYSTWWRVRVRGIASIPEAGPVIVAANHAGVVPWDALVLRHALRRDHPAHRDLRPLLDDRECALPLFGHLAVRAGAVRATPEGAARLLAEGTALGVFPEGSAGARKPWRDRYTLLRFGRGGLVKLALRARAPVVPCAIVGSEEASPGISRTGWLAERLGIPLLATSPSLRLAPAALLPLPSRWTLRFGEPIEVLEHPASAADDPATVNALTERVRTAVQSMLDEDVAARTSVFL